jgi:molecular chaperone DnaK
LKVVPTTDGMCGFLINDTLFSPTDILAEYLRFIKTKLALQFIRQDSLCIALPVLFNRVQQISLAKAAYKAGISDFIHIPASLSASLELGQEFKNTQTLAVVHFGAGVFDICIVEVGDGVFEVLYYGGDPNVGGIDFDHRIYELFLDEISNAERNRINKDALTRHIIQNQLRIAKETLSHSPEAKEMISIPASESHKWNLSADKINKATSDLIQRTRHNCQLAANVVQDSSKHSVQVFMIGGMTRLHSVRQAILQSFHSDTPPVDLDDSSIAVGAAIKAGIWTGKIKDVLLLDVLSGKGNLDTKSDQNKLD